MNSFQSESLPSSASVVSSFACERQRHAVSEILIMRKRQNRNTHTLKNTARKTDGLQADSVRVRVDGVGHQFLWCHDFCILRRPSSMLSMTHGCLMLVLLEFREILAVASVREVVAVVIRCRCLLVVVVGVSILLCSVCSMTSQVLVCV